jgi:hypothetical protein
MGKHEDGCERADKDSYPTPSWVTWALIEYIPVAGKRIWELAAGRGDMAEVLAAAGAEVCATDIEARGYAKINRLLDFTATAPAELTFSAIITNPPFGARGALATRFAELGLERIGDRGLMALLLPNDFDCAKTRRHLFGDCPAFAAKITLTKRIVWFERVGSEERAAPKENHSWFVWRRPVIGRPIVLYAPTDHHPDFTNSAAVTTAVAEKGPAPSQVPTPIQQVAETY